jgi:DNA-binding GntR family transcriptional regulator
MSHSTLSRKVFESLRLDILNFTYLPGVRLSDDEIAATMKVSRTPVREALNRLSELGIVEAKSNRGFKVKDFSEKEIEDIYILRNNLECLSVELTISRLNSDVKQRLYDSLCNYPTIIKSADLWEFNLADTAFHDTIAECCGNYELRNTLSRLYDKIQIIRRNDHLRAGSLKRTYEQHLEIYENIISTNVNKARKSMSKHILNSMNIVIEIKRKRVRVVRWTTWPSKNKEKKGEKK